MNNIEEEHHCKTIKFQVLQANSKLDIKKEQILCKRKKSTLDL